MSGPRPIARPKPWLWPARLDLRNAPYEWLIADLHWWRLPESDRPPMYFRCATKAALVAEILRRRDEREAAA